LTLHAGWASRRLTIGAGRRAAYRSYGFFGVTVAAAGLAVVSAGIPSCAATARARAVTLDQRCRALEITLEIVVLRGALCAALHQA